MYLCILFQFDLLKEIENPIPRKCFRSYLIKAQIFEVYIYRKLIYNLLQIVTKNLPSSWAGDQK